MQTIIRNDQITVAFDQFGPDPYATFLRCKKLPEYALEFDAETASYRISAPARYAHLLGVEVPSAKGARLPLAPHLWDYQRWITEVAIKAKRYAVWADCGMGKTAIYWDWARIVSAMLDGRVLVFSPPNIIDQSIEQAQQFYGQLEIDRIHTREELAAWCKAPGARIGITNYEKMIPGIMDELRYLVGVALDESSILKTGGGVIKWNMIKSCRGIEYKLSLTGTPAPNEPMEYASQAAFLEKLRNEQEILWTWFSKDKTGEWYIKPHAKAGFYRFMAGWSVYLRNPAAYGFSDNTAPPPEPEFLEIDIEPTHEQTEAASRITTKATGDMLPSDRLGVAERGKLSQIAKGFIYSGKGKDRQVRRIDSKKPEVIAELTRLRVEAGDICLIWTVFDEEAEILRDAIGISGIEALGGSTPEKERHGIIERFRHGQTRVLISKPRVLGYGMNFHHVRTMIFSGWDDSFEAWYQALRRAWRTGQTQRLKVFTPVIPGLEGAMLANVQAKARRFEEETAVMENFYRQAMKELQFT